MRTADDRADEPGPRLDRHERALKRRGDIPGRRNRPQAAGNGFFGERLKPRIQRRVHPEPAGIHRVGAEAFDELALDDAAEIAGGAGLPWIALWRLLRTIPARLDWRGKSGLEILAQQSLIVHLHQHEIAPLSRQVGRFHG
jgi:hypothetical protein